MDAQVLFRSFRAKTTQSTTAITSIVIRKANQRVNNHYEVREQSERNEAIQKNP